MFLYEEKLNSHILDKWNEYQENKKSYAVLGCVNEG